MRVNLNHSRVIQLNFIVSLYSFPKMKGELMVLTFFRGRQTLLSQIWGITCFYYFSKCVVPHRIIPFGKDHPLSFLSPVFGRVA